MSNNLIKKNFGGDRLGSGKKMEVALHNFERSSHNMGRMWKSTMAPAVLTPCLVEVALNGDTWEMDFAAAIKTQPAILPMYGSFKFQVDAFACPVRLYIKELHNNALNIGRNMDKVFFPIMTVQGENAAINTGGKNKQINQSSLLAYTGTRGIGRRNNAQGNEIVKRKINATPIIASITPKIDYSQGNKWFNTQLFTLDDLHKPNLDGIGFQDAVTDQIALFDLFSYPSISASAFSLL
jgi:hypothetical protein